MPSKGKLHRNDSEGPEHRPAKRMQRRPLILSPLLALLPTLSRAAPTPTVLPLWPEGVPAAVRADAPAARGDLGTESVDANGAIANVSVPTLTVVPPAVDRPNGTAVILCPGGGYRYLSWQREGLQYAAWLSTLGITTFILKSRLQEWGHPAPLQDVLRAHPPGALARGRVRRRPPAHRRDGQFRRRPPGGQRQHAVRPCRRPHRRRAGQQHQRPARLRRARLPRHHDDRPRRPPRLAPRAARCRAWPRAAGARPRSSSR
jgi:hypothetical protein